MTYKAIIRGDKNFLGNKNKMEVHDLNKEDKNRNGCQIEEFLEAGHGVGFDPDTLEQAYKKGFNNCARCLGNSNSH